MLLIAANFCSTRPKSVKGSTPKIGRYKHQDDPRIKHGLPAHSPVIDDFRLKCPFLGEKTSFVKHPMAPPNKKRRLETVKMSQLRPRDRIRSFTWLLSHVESICYMILT
jgi:hypothetical protein